MGWSMVQRSLWSSLVQFCWACHPTCVLGVQLRYVKVKCLLRTSTSYPNCAVELLGSAQLCLKACTPLVTAVFDRKTSFSTNITSSAPPLPSRGLQEFSLVISTASPWESDMGDVLCKQKNVRGLKATPLPRPFGLGLVFENMLWSHLGTH